MFGKYTLKEIPNEGSMGGLGEESEGVGDDSLRDLSNLTRK